MYGRNIARTDAGRNGRIYCTTEKKGIKKVINYKYIECNYRYPFI
jgi:hypothetical protein